jgi:hypothetical protein
MAAGGGCIAPVGGIGRRIQACGCGGLFAPYGVLFPNVELGVDGFASSLDKTTADDFGAKNSQTSQNKTLISQLPIAGLLIMNKKKYDSIPTAFYSGLWRKVYLSLLQFAFYYWSIISIMISPVSGKFLGIFS